MKHLTILTACLFSLQMLHAQSIVLDSSFADNGCLQTYMYPGDDHGTNFEMNTDQQLVFAGSTRVGQQSFFSIQKYSTSGDSIGGIFIPTNNTNYIDCTAMKMMADGGFVISDIGATNGLIKIDPNGQIDSTFGTNGHAFLFYTYIHDILITKENRILVAGENLNDYMDAPAGSYVIAYDMNGQLDTTFADHGKFRYLLGKYGFFNRIQELQDGKLVIAGCSSIAGIGTFHTVVKLLPNGDRDSTFGINGVVEDFLFGSGENYGLMIQPDQKIVVCGDIYNIQQAMVARYMPDGSPDMSFGTNGVLYFYEIQEASDLLMLPNGKLLIYGWRRDSVDRSALVQLLPNGQRDPSFGTNGVFFSPLDNFSPPLQMKLVDGNKIIATGKRKIYTSNSTSSYLQLQGFVLDLNVGVITPNNPLSVWAYPNPVHDAFQIGFSLETAQDLQIDLYDLQGKFVQNIQQKTAFEIGDHTVPMTLTEGLPAGNYLLTMSSGGQQAVTVQILKL